MSKTLFRQEAIKMLRKNSKVTYISEKSISLHLNLELKLQDAKQNMMLLSSYKRWY